MRAYLYAGLILSSLVLAPLEIQAAAASKPAAPKPAETTSSAEPSEGKQTITPQALQQRVVSPDELFAMVAGEAEKGSPQAMLNMGVLYERGIGVPLNFGKALEWYKKAAAGNVPEAAYNVGVCYEIGMGTAPDPVVAMSYFERASGQGLPQAAYKLARVYLAAGDETKGFDQLLRAAELGHPGGNNDLGVIFLQGLLGKKKDEKRAIELFSRSADSGNLEAVKNIAVMYKDGLGQKADPVKAYMWYLIARKGGYPEADVAPVLDTLKSRVTHDQATKAEADADAWIENYRKRKGGG